MRCAGHTGQASQQFNSLWGRQPPHLKQNYSEDLTDYWFFKIIKHLLYVRQARIMCVPVAPKKALAGVLGLDVAHDCLTDHCILES